MPCGKNPPNKLVAVPRQRGGNLGRVDCRQRVLAAQVTNALLRHPRIQVARARMTVQDFAATSHAETFFGAFVSLLLGHDKLPSIRKAG